MKIIKYLILGLISLNCFGGSTMSPSPINSSSSLVISDITSSNGYKGSIISPEIIPSASTVTVTKSMINLAPNSELRLIMTNTVALFTIATNSFDLYDAGTWAISIVGTNPITADTNIISGWTILNLTNSLTVPNDLIFRKSAGKYVIGVKQ